MVDEIFYYAFHSKSEGVTYAISLSDIRFARDVTERLFSVLPEARYDEMKAYYVVDSVEAAIAYALELSAQNPNLVVDYWVLAGEEE